jgi:hypothetical protein
MRLNINLATQPYQDARQFWSRWGLGLVALGLLTLALLYAAVSGWWAARRDLHAISQIQDAIHQRDKEKAQAEEILGRPENRTMREQSQFLNDLIRRKSFSWTRVMADLEPMMPPQLHVVAIEPELKNNELQIKMSVAGQTRDRALELVKHMEKSPRFRDPLLHTETQNQGGQNPADAGHFEITAVYLPEAVRSRP